MSDAVDEARALLRQGLLREAGAALARVPADAPAAERAPAALLSGNIAYERGLYVEARAEWLRAEALYTQAGADGTQSVATNLALADERLARRAELDAQAGTLRLELGGVVTLALLAVVLAWKLSKPTPRAMPTSRP